MEMHEHNYRPRNAGLKTETDNQCEECHCRHVCIIVCFAKSLTFPVITKLMISFDLWRLREAIGLRVLKCCYISRGDAAKAR